MFGTLELRKMVQNSNLTLHTIPHSQSCSCFERKVFSLVALLLSLLFTTCYIHWLVSISEQWAGIEFHCSASCFSLGGKKSFLFSMAKDAFWVSESGPRSAEKGVAQSEPNYLLKVSQLGHVFHIWRSQGSLQAGSYFRATRWSWVLELIWLICEWVT